MSFETLRALLFVPRHLYIGQFLSFPCFNFLIMCCQSEIDRYSECFEFPNLSYFSFFIFRIIILYLSSFLYSFFLDHFLSVFVLQLLTINALVFSKVFVFLLNTVSTCKQCTNHFSISSCFCFCLIFHSFCLEGVLRTSLFLVGPTMTGYKYLSNC